MVAPTPHDVYSPHGIANAIKTVFITLTSSLLSLFYILNMEDFWNYRKENAPGVIFP